MGKTIEIAGVCLEEDNINDNISLILDMVSKDNEHWIVYELERRGYTVFYEEKSRTLRDALLEEAFIEAREKYTYDELMKRLS